MGISKQGVVSFNGSPNPNLLPHTDTRTYGLGYMGVYSSGTREVDNTVLFNGKPTIKIKPSSSSTSSGANNTYNNSVVLTNGQQYCYSLWILSTDADIWSHSSLGHFQTNNGTAAHNMTGNSAILTNIPANTWTYVAQIFTPNKDNCKFISYHIYFANTSQTIWISDVKLEKGNTPTLWTPNENDDIYVGNSSFVENNDICKIQKQGYIQSPNFIEI